MINQTHVMAAHDHGDSGNQNLAAQLIGVSKAYPHFQLDQIHFELQLGTISGLIGPNGAGKSTIMRILMGLVNPDAGTVHVLGQSISSTAGSAKQEIGYFSDDMRLYKPESINWHMQFVRSLYPSWDDLYATTLLDRFGLVREQSIKGLSHGQRVKTMLLLILARQPKLLILDEPTNGLDPVAKQEVLSELMHVMQDEDRTILYSSHNTQDVEQISDSITFIDRGRVISAGDRDLFLERWKRIRLTAPDDWQAPAIDGLRLESTFRSLRVFSSNDFRPEIPQLLHQAGATIEGVEPMTLEEIFVSSVMRGRGENQR